MSQEIQTLIEMGFPRSKVEKALAATNHKGIEPAMEWLLLHVDDDDEFAAATSASVSSFTAQGETSSDPSAVARSLRCDDCGKLFKSQEEVEFHAAKTEHSNFSESTEEKKPLTEEQKQEQLVILEERMKAKRKDREEKEKAEMLERERLRIRSGKDLQDARQRMQEQETKKMVEQRRQDRLDEQAARERVRQQIASDKEARRLAAAQKAGGEVSVSSTPTPPATVLTTSSLPQESKSYEATRLQLRLPDGRALTHTFGAKEQLAAVRLYIELNAKDALPTASLSKFGMMTTFPKKVFSDEDYDKPLDVLGLVPSAVVIVTKPVQQ